MDCGGVTVVDKTWRISVEPQDPSIFRIPANTGSKIRAWGIILVGGGEEGEQGEEVGQKEQEESEETEVVFKAKGVEIL